MAVKGCSLEWEQEVTLYLDRELPTSSIGRVERHVQSCEMCSRFLLQLEREEQLLAGALRHDADEFFFNMNLANQVMEALPAYQPNPLVRRFQLWKQQVHEFFQAEGRRHLALALSMCICVIGILFALKVGNVEEQQYLHIKHNTTLVRTTLPDLFLSATMDGDYFEFPDTSLVYATFGTWFTVEAYQQDSGVSAVGTERRLSLKTGEMFVDVHPEQEGFSIVCSNAKATVFGTQFYIAINPGPDKETVIAVREGTVMVEKQGRNQVGSTVVNGGQMTKVITKDGKVILRSPVPISAELLERLDRFSEARNKRVWQRFSPSYSPMENPHFLETNKDLINAYPGVEYK